VAIEDQVTKSVENSTFNFSLPKGVTVPTYASKGSTLNRVGFSIFANKRENHAKEFF